MNSELAQQLMLMALEALLVAAVLLALFRVRLWAGLSPFYMALGVLLPLQMLISRGVFIEAGPVLQVSPGSAVLFTASLFAILLVYIREDALAARNLIYTLLGMHLILSALLWLVSGHLDSPVVRNLYALPESLFLTNPRAMIVGTVVLYIDVLLVVLIFEAYSRWLPRWFFARAWLSLATVLTVDSLLFISGTFWGHAYYYPMLASAVTGKVLLAGVYAAALTLYLRHLEHPDRSVPLPQPGIADLFQVLTYRQKYQLLLAELVRDPLTGIFNRAFLDQRLPRVLAAGRSMGLPTSLLMIDIDHFKQVNDNFGHPTGDLILKRVAQTLSNQLRESDFVCRYGGEEFGVVLPNADGEVALMLAERIRKRMAETSSLEQWLPGDAPITLTTGLATSPAEAETAAELIAEADRRLYAGKQAGRDRVVFESIVVPPA